MSELHDIIKKGRGLGDSTRERYLKSVDDWIAYAGDNPAEWTRPKAVAFYDHLLGARKLAPQSANQTMAGLRYASKWWAYYQHKPELDFASIQLEPNGERIFEKKALTREQIEPLIKSLCPPTIKGTPAPADLRDLAIIMTLLETGMRKMSLVAMMLQHTFSDEAHIKASGAPYPMTRVPLKGSRGRMIPVPLSDTAVAAITPWRAWLALRGVSAKGPLFQALDSKVSSRGVLVTEPSRELMHEDAINKMLTRRAEAAGIGHIYPHQFRHTFVTWRIDAGLAPHEIAAMTGHTLKGIGAMAGYIDMTTIAAKIRNSTPAWLKELVMR